MKKTLMGCGGCLGLALLALGVVLFLASRMPAAHSVSSRIELSATPETLWPLISDLEGQAEWNADIESVALSQTADGRTLFTQETTWGPIPLVILESVEPSRFKTEIHGEAMGWGGTWTWTIEPAEGGSVVTLREDGHVDGLLMRFVSHQLMGLHTAMDGSLMALASAVDDDEAVPTHVE